MQAPTSFGIVAIVVGVTALAIALAVTIAAPILAVPFIVFGIAAFLVWRGKRQANATLRDRYGDRVPTTEETAGDPVGDSGAGVVARSGGSRAETRGA